MKRLREGKVYTDDAAQRALTNYFKEGNLTALRELTLRRAAERVDGQMRDYMRLHGIPGPWAAGDRIMVCLSERPVATQLIRHAKRVADRLNAPWVAVYVETARSQQLSEPERGRVAAAMLSAEQQGAETVTLPGTPRLAEAILAYAHEANVTQIVIGKSLRPRWFELLHGSVVRDLVDRAGNITVHVLTEDALADPSWRTATTRRVPNSAQGLQYLLAILPVAVATGIALLIDHVAHLPNISLVYLGAVLAAVRFGPGPSLFAALLSAGCYNFFLLPPTYTFTIADPANVLALLVFLLVAVFASRLAGRVRSQTRMARDQARTTAALLSVSRRLSGMRSSDELVSAIATQIATLVSVQCVVLVPDREPLALKGAAPNPAKLTDADLAAARWSFEKNQVAGRGSDTLPGARMLFIPVRTGRGVFGVIGADTGAERVLGPDERRLLDALADLAAISLERIQLAKDVDLARLEAETEKMRAALLTSVSHDLRTPLASILAAITSLRSYGNLFDPAERDDTLATAQEETERLNRFVSNLLDLTRLDAGALVPKRETCDLHDLLGSAIKRLARALANHKVEIDIPEPFPLVEVDFLLMEQVFVNLLDNAAKYSPPESVIAVRARGYRFSATVSVIDEGPGIPPTELDRVFERFHRSASDRQPAGTGLGLAICKGFVNAMGSVIRASNRKDRSGAEFTIDIPSDRIVRIAVGAGTAAPQVAE
jgi:two-component system sensor histidine kinase KdpD